MQGRQQADPQGQASAEADPEQRGQKTQARPQQRVAVICQSILPGIHAHEYHGIVFIIGGVKQIRVHIGADKGQEK